MTGDAENAMMPLMLDRADSSDDDEDVNDGAAVVVDEALVLSPGSQEDGVKDEARAARWAAATAAKRAPVVSTSEAAVGPGTSSLVKDGSHASNDESYSSDD